MDSFSPAARNSLCRARRCVHGCAVFMRACLPADQINAGFIEFDSVEAATAAVAMAGQTCAGRPARISFAYPKDGQVC